MHVFSKPSKFEPSVISGGEVVYELLGNSTPVSTNFDQKNSEPERSILPNHSLAHISISPGDSSRPHHHKFCQESYFVLSGQATMRVDQDEFILEPGQACLIIPGQIHQIMNNGTQLLEFLAVCVPAWFPDDSVYL